MNKLASGMSLRHVEVSEMKEKRRVIKINGHQVKLWAED